MKPVTKRSQFRALVSGFIIVCSMLLLLFRPHLIIWVGVYAVFQGILASFYPSIESRNVNTGIKRTLFFICGLIMSELLVSTSFVQKVFEFNFNPPRLLAHPLGFSITSLMFLFGKLIREKYKFFQ